MIISFLIGYAIGYALGRIIAEICIRISSYWNAKEEIKQKAAAQVDKPISLFEVYLKNTAKVYDEEELVLKTYDSNHNEIAKINVTAENGTNLKIGQTF
ncbi:MAG: hypothetical protein V8Q76_14770 [Bacteroides intestinalis]